MLSSFDQSSRSFHAQAFWVTAIASGCRQSKEKGQPHLRAVQYGALDNEREHSFFVDHEVDIVEHDVTRSEVHDPVPEDVDHLGFMNLKGPNGTTCKEKRAGGGKVIVTT